MNKISLFKLKKKMQKVKRLFSKGSYIVRSSFSGKKIVIFGSCRLQYLAPKSYIHQVHHTHNTKEAIQYIQYINGCVDIDNNMNSYVFRSCYLDSNFFIDQIKLREEFLKSDIVVVELCSRKKYLKKGCFIHHLSADKGDMSSKNLIENEKINSNYELVIQGKDELESDMLEIVELLHDKEVIFVTHIDYGIEIRKVLIDEISEICDKHGFLCVNPSDILTELKKEMVDSNHYTSHGLRILANYIWDKVDSSYSHQK